MFFLNAHKICVSAASPSRTLLSLKWGHSAFTKRGKAGVTPVFRGRWFANPYFPTTARLRPRAKNPVAARNTAPSNKKGGPQSPPFLLRIATDLCPVQARRILWPEQE